MLWLTPELAAAVMAHAQASHPLEACGLIAGPRWRRAVPARADAQRPAVEPGVCF